MARRPREQSRKTGSDNGGGTNGVPAAGPSRTGPETNREKIIEAFMGLLGEQSIEQIGLPDIAARSGVSMADMRGEFGSQARDPRRARQEHRSRGSLRRSHGYWAMSPRASGCSTC